MATTTARRHPTVLASILATGALLLAACSGDDDTAAATITESPSDPSASAAAPDAAPDIESESPPTATAVAPVESTAPPTTQPPDPANAVSSADDDGDGGDGGDGGDDGDAGDDGDDASRPADATTPVDTTTAPTDAISPASDPGGVDWAGIATDLLARHFEIPRRPSLDLVRAVCVEPSGCFDDAARTVDVLLADGVRLVGGTPFEVTSVEFQGTADGAAVAESLAVNLLIRFVATDQGTVQLVNADGEVVSDVAPDDRFAPGQPATRAVILGRDSAGAGWKLVALSDWM